MPDIRSFFGGKGSQGVGSSQEKSTPKQTVSLVQSFTEETLGASSIAATDPV